MSDPLLTYLHDHLAGAEFGLELLRDLREQHATNETGALASRLETEVEEDRSTLQQLARQLNGGTNAGKTVVSWLAEKASRLKLRRGAAAGLGLFESLEALALGILGKEALWTALETAAPVEPRLAGFDFGALAARARHQHAQVEAHRRILAAVVFSASPSSTR
jgi:hypothetical protein